MASELCLRPSPWDTVSFSIISPLMATKACTLSFHDARSFWLRLSGFISPDSSRETVLLEVSKALLCFEILLDVEVWTTFGFELVLRRHHFDFKLSSSALRVTE